jgi:hypothetical protein
MFFEVDNQVLPPLGISNFLRPAPGLFDARKEIPVQRPTLEELENAKLLAHNNLPFLMPVGLLGVRLSGKFLMCGGEGNPFGATRN